MNLISKRISQIQNLIWICEMCGWLSDILFVMYSRRLRNKQPKHQSEMVNTCNHILLR